TLGTIVAGSDGQWNFDDTQETLADGNYNFTAYATGRTGDHSHPSPPLHIAVDRPPPPAPRWLGFSLHTGNLGDAVTSARNLTLLGTAELGSTVVVSRDGHTLGTIQTGSDGQWSFDDTKDTLADGNYNFTAFATDSAGNDSPSTPPLH